MTGTVKKTGLQIGRGYGFIKCDDESPDVFFHARDCEDLPWEETIAGMRVSYVVEETPRGRRAFDVNVAQADQTRIGECVPE